MLNNALRLFRQRITSLKTTRKRRRKFNLQTTQVLEARALLSGINLSGVAYHDMGSPANGTYDAGEEHTSGTITVLSELGETSTQIDALGNYQVEVTAGDYIVTFNDGTTSYIVEGITVDTSDVVVDFDTSTAAEEVDIDFTIAVESISENGGSTTATVTRSGGDIASEYVVDLLAFSSDITIPASVTFPAGATSADFPITAVDNGTLDGAREAEIFIDAPDAVPDADVFWIRDYETSLAIDGSELDDVFVYTHEQNSTTHKIEINGVDYEFEGESLSITFNGGDGNDVLDVEATSGNDTISMTPEEITVNALADLNLSGINIEVVRIDGNGGTDAAQLGDAQGLPDLAVLKPTEAWMQGQGAGNTFYTLWKMLMLSPALQAETHWMLCRCMAAPTMTHWSHSIVTRR